MTTFARSTRSAFTAIALGCLMAATSSARAEDVIDTGTNPGDPMVVIDDGAVIDTGVNPGDPIVVIQDGGDNPEIMQANGGIMPNQRNVQSASSEYVSSGSGTIIRHKCSFLKPCKVK